MKIGGRGKEEENMKGGERGTTNRVNRKRKRRRMKKGKGRGRKREGRMRGEEGR